MRKRLFIFLFLVLSGALYAQQLTRFAMVDLQKVYIAFFRDSRPVREFEERSARVQAEIDKRTKDITDMRGRYQDALSRGDQTEANRLDSQIHRNVELLNDYYQTQTSILENIKKQLTQSGAFLDQVNDEIRYIAESEGYSVVMDLSQNKGIIWYSPTVDITDRLIQNLRTKSGRN